MKLVSFASCVCVKDASLCYERKVFRLPELVLNLSLFFRIKQISYLSILSIFSYFGVLIMIVLYGVSQSPCEFVTMFSNNGGGGGGGDGDGVEQHIWSPAALVPVITFTHNLSIRTLRLKPLW